MTILSIGKSTYDITIPVDSYPTENTKMIVTEKLEGSGGSASNISYLLGKWNEEAYFAGTVGYDDFGSSIKKELESVGVKTNYLETNYERKTTTAFIINNKSTTSRTQILIEPEIFHLKKYEYDISPYIIYSDGFEYSATMAAVNKYKTVPLVLGMGLSYGDPKELLSLAKYAKYLVFSKEFAEKYTKMTINTDDSTSLLNLYKELKVSFNEQNIIVTLGNAGVIYEQNGSVQYMPTIPVKEIDRTAAGDAFDGAFVYALSKGYDIEKCMRIANIAAGLSTTKFGGKTSFPLLSDVISYYESKFGPIESSVQTSAIPETNTEQNSNSASPDSL